MTLRFVWPTLRQFISYRYAEGTSTLVASNVGDKCRWQNMLVTNLATFDTSTSNYLRPTATSKKLCQNFTHKQTLSTTSMYISNSNIFAFHFWMTFCLDAIKMGHTNFNPYCFDDCSTNEIKVSISWVELLSKCLPAINHYLSRCWKSRPINQSRMDRLRENHNLFWYGVIPYFSSLTVPS